MDYIQGIGAQTEIFFFSLGFGFLLGILYDVFRTLRIIISDAKGFVIAADLIYFAVCSFLMFCFNLIVDNGRVRVYVIVGEILGWMIYYFSLGTLAIKLTNSVRRFFKSRIFAPIRRFFGTLRKKMSSFGKKAKKYLKNTIKK